MTSTFTSWPFKEADSLEKRFQEQPKSPVIFETGLLKKVGNYPTNFTHAEDYAFFYQLIKITHSHILDEFLVVCEINHRGISLKNRQEQLTSRARIIMKYGTNPVLKIIGVLRIYALRLVPKRLLLQLRKLVK